MSHNVGHLESLELLEIIEMVEMTDFSGTLSLVKCRASASRKALGAVCAEAPKTGLNL